MCNDLTNTVNSKRIFQYFVLFYVIKLIHSKSVKRYDECNRFLIVNDCYYFPCLDAHYSCGRDNYLTRFSYDFCVLSTKKYVSQLTTAGQFYFNQTNICLMKSLDEQLIEEKISARFTCTHLQAFILKLSLNCFQNHHQQKNQLVTVNDFCSITCDNLQTIVNLFLNLNFEFADLYHLLRETGKSCGAKMIDSTAQTLPAVLIAICLDRKNVRLKQDITTIMLNSRFEITDYDWTAE